MGTPGLISGHGRHPDEIIMLLVDGQLAFLFIFWRSGSSPCWDPASGT
jgi:hypothetical protein